MLLGYFNCISVCKYPELLINIKTLPFIESKIFRNSFKSSLVELKSDLNPSASIFIVISLKLSSKKFKYTPFGNLLLGSFIVDKVLFIMFTQFLIQDSLTLLSFSILLFIESNISSEFIISNPSSIKPSANMQPLMGKIMQGVGSDEDRVEFAKLWQERVGKILLADRKSLIIKG